MSIFSNKKAVLATGHCDSYFPGENHISIARIYAENKWRLLNDIETACQCFSRPSIMKSIDASIACYHHDLGHSVYECPVCDNFTFVWHTCKDRFCNKCGIKTAKKLSASIMSKVFDCSHRHAVFTVPEPLRYLFLEDRSLLNELFGAVNDTLSFVVRKAGTKDDELIPSAVLVLHTFGRSLNWIPHVHVLLAEGGVRKSGSFKKLGYINYDSLRFSFQNSSLSVYLKR